MLEQEYNAIRDDVAQLGRKYIGDFADLLAKSDIIDTAMIVILLLNSAATIAGTLTLISAQSIDRPFVDAYKIMLDELINKLYKSYNKVKANPEEYDTCQQ